jgi:hypothetical protein
MTSSPAVSHPHDAITSRFPAFMTPSPAFSHFHGTITSRFPSRSPCCLPVFLEKVRWHGCFQHMFPKELIEKELIECM